MKRSITVLYDDSWPNKVMIGTHEKNPNAWDDLALLIEGVGVLVGACSNAGISEHDGQPLNEYLKSYIDKVCNDYRTISFLPGGGDR